MGAASSSSVLRLPVLESLDLLGHLRARNCRRVGVAEAGVGGQGCLTLAFPSFLRPDD